MPGFLGFRLLVGVLAVRLPLVAPGLLAAMLHLPVL